jgi:hypothetical protein
MTLLKSNVDVLGLKNVYLRCFRTEKDVNENHWCSKEELSKEIEGVVRPIET